MDVKVTGAVEVESALRSLGVNAERKMLRTALRAGAQPVAQTAANTAPEKTGLLGSSIKINNGTTKAGTVSVRISPSKARLEGSRKYFYATSVEGGFFLGKRLPKVTKGFLGNHRFYSKGQYREASLAAGRTFVEGTHWMERTYEATKVDAANIIAETLVQQVHDEWNR